ncbi:hypothetical protein J6590_035610 [Homalodisca vitripennis]|nr:hypothetical protein J6590_035610 [Homalodisca vitripennis]
MNQLFSLLTTNQSSRFFVYANRVSTNSEIDRLLDSDSDDDSVMTELDFAQMEFDQTNSDNEFQDIVGLDNEEVEDFANLGGGDGNASRPRPRQMANSDMIWETMNTYNGMKVFYVTVALKWKQTAF